MKVFARLLPLALLTACAGQTLPPAMTQAALNPSLNRFSTPALRSFSAGTSQRKFPHGLGLNLQGSQPMREDGQTFSIMANRPQVVDLRPGFSPIYNQGATNACVGFSSIGGFGEYFARKRGWNMRFSPRFLWNMGRKMEGTLAENTGMMISDAQRILDAYGMMPDQSFPFPVLDPEQNPALFNQLLTEQPNSAQIAEAKKFRFSQGWKQINTVSAMRTALADGKPVVFGIAVFRSIGMTGPDGLIPNPGPNDEFLGGHAVVAVGYDNTRKVFIIRNSWGQEWGDKGYGYLSYDFFRSVLKVAPAYAGFTVK
ncbi:hypothetical protein COW36_20530 [bacterium (Candidatus Blackallbacteria) CG17_big_fil_post_rev_8_21_14_2_50_48_46]|uniref:Peptidase C1A papain C-terminal domain-containing protein n=1 Tax=bacterium (Candidatus Blackallbacteria) CG17_big_fil_post_rev_8_21_14_2_50_48_46 TaxID=2014261 RepID=A0A2M7G0N3_9BACT|nr:MAG: hypothetical protein COW64_22855 [bacterium (Candidatus Blackallbacteria) CG18_big_fil_WC_8_21_14_2_50_49_26]PIW14792.1 MAG: hypothetical protein COW36_20530 [bacterium (Candidatus Blackallbacteria) CG17_big_fil_post_rev_8_21_14_2_50_48_46]PIW50894.1 MAG: hypothetical protein COW20_01345 [bacterium (Candidatus Blackallbacteria) CG13_big_fil_rev_8_21_14_2_50_49_14]